ncbi:unnamed protein product [Spirodela intermedia]|uniref:WRKY domain-containing protein n=1 Tax=Spirodela intermedia TaxID=51605 RepID=A0A7I8LGA0_SPIIN|nr:unnamed protein product [Spirodela intermedia]
MVGEGWDLRAVVEGFSGSTPMADPFSFPLQELQGWLREGEVAEKDEPLFCFPDQVAAHRAFQELEEFLRPFFPQPPPNQNQGSPCPSSSHSSPQKLHQIQHPQKKPTKRRKKQQKKVVCELPADFLSDDVWAWRKYGQKPIKGSPYPRGYYRCSSSKVCPARKQVERSRTNPEMFIITYTSEHNHEAPAHRNSHAGGAARPKSPPRFSATADKAPLSSPPAGDGDSPATPPPQRRQGEEEAEEDLVVEDVDVLGDFVSMDLDQLIEDASSYPAVASPAGFADDLFDHFGFVSPPWIAGS